ncbi:MAG: DUF3089 domain-containing protein [Bacteroidales bacterium]|nr:DUF3089 domain-containing protein [Candidatus Colicola equi]
MRKIILALVAGAILVGCSKKAEWPVDVFYIASTNVISSQDEEGNEVYNATLTQAEREMIQPEIEWMAEQIGDSVNFFAPFYHQFTMNAILLPQDSFAIAFETAKQDVRKQFKQYLRHHNQRRPFFIVGFSQGAMMIPTLLNEMPKRYYQRCLGAYMMGYQLTAEDLQSDRIVPATSATDGKVISYNTVTRVERQWPFVSGQAATCINPLNWTTDGTPAILYYQQDTLIITQDTVHNLLICNAEEQRYTIPGASQWWQSGCLHHWDLLFYAKAIKENMEVRGKRYEVRGKR